MAAAVLWLLSCQYSVGWVLTEPVQSKTKTRPSKNASKTEMRLRPPKSGLETKTNLQGYNTCDPPISRTAVHVLTGRRGGTDPHTEAGRRSGGLRWLGVEPLCLGGQKGGWSHHHNNNTPTPWRPTLWCSSCSCHSHCEPHVGQHGHSQIESQDYRL